MDVNELARKVHDRVNGSDESKFPKTLLVVAEVLYACGPMNYFGWCTRSIARGDCDEDIIKFCGDYNDDSLEEKNRLHDSFNNMRQEVVEFKSQVVKGLCVSTLVLGSAVVGCCYMVFSFGSFVMG